MAKKHWIYIKRGLSEDPKHRAAMGECIWLYMHIIDRADWETGIAFDWKDKEEAAEMSISVDTLRWQRQKLEDGDYIRCKQKQHGQDIKIMEWRNPRDYLSEVKNPRNTTLEGSNETQPSENEGLNEGLNQVPRQIKTPTSNSKSKVSKLKDGASAKPKPPTPPEVLLFRETTNRYPNKINWDDVVGSIQKMAARLLRPVTRDDLLPFYKFWCARAYNPLGLGWLEWAEIGETPKNALWKPQKYGLKDAISQFLQAQPQEEVINGVTD